METLEKGGKAGGDVPSPSSLLGVPTLGICKVLSGPTPITCSHAFPPAALEAPLRPCLPLQHPSVALVLSSSSPNNGVFIFSNTTPLFSKDFSIYYLTCVLRDGLNCDCNPHVVVFRKLAQKSPVARQLLGGDSVSKNRVSRLPAGAFPSAPPQLEFFHPPPSSLSYFSPIAPTSLNSCLSPGAVSSNTTTNLPR